MWKRVLVAVVAVGCGKSGGESQKPDPAISAAALARVPQIETADVLAADDGRPPPMIVFVDEAGEVQITAAASWSDLTTRDLRTGARGVKLEIAARVLRESLAIRRTPAQIVAAIAAAPAEPPPPPAVEPPPADEDADEEDDGSEESGGVRSMVNLDESRTADVREVERQRDSRERQRFMLHRNTGWRGARPIVESPDGEAVRLATVVGQSSSDGRFEEDPPALVLAAPRAKASALIRTVSAIEGMIAVAHDGAIRPLRLSFVSEGARSKHEPPWIEARVSIRGIGLEAVPSVPVAVAWQGAAIDRTALATALDATRKNRGLDRLAPIDVLVEPDVDVQRLVDLLVALDLVGARTIGLGEAPAAGSPELAQRGRRIPRVRQGGIQRQGDLDKPVIVAILGGKVGDIRACYEAALATKPFLQGTVSVQMFIAPNGLVAMSSANGVDPAVSDCVAKVIKTTVFPHPKGGGGVQVNVPFRLRP